MDMDMDILTIMDMDMTMVLPIITVYILTHIIDYMTTDTIVDAMEEVVATEDIIIINIFIIITKKAIK